MRVRLLTPRVAVDERGFPLVFEIDDEVDLPAEEARRLIADASAVPAGRTKADSRERRVLAPKENR